MEQSEGKSMALSGNARFQYWLCCQLFGYLTLSGPCIESRGTFGMRDFEWAQLPGS